MIELPIFQVDAFTNKMFGGNPAAVCPLPVMLSSDILQNLAAENNLSETAFFVGLPEDDEADFLLRWFTPTTEVDLCGHATLASAYLVLKHMKPDWQQVKFNSRSGILTVTRNGEKFSMEFPSFAPVPVNIPEGLGAAMGAEPEDVLKSDKGDRDLLLVYPDAATVQALEPDMAALKAFAPYGFIATARGDGDVDFVSRCFFPNHGIEEDPVTGSAHCVSAPYWTARLDKSSLFAQQISKRGGDLWIEVGENTVTLTGSANEYMQGVYYLPE